MGTGKKQKTSITADDIFKTRKSAPKKSENTADSIDQKDDKETGANN